ncbi:hypothetical protein LCGC14_2155290 [marine sediment metagenome]|uniref:DUF2971 domain-containing protein n=1 Tax=marine sediment metagenome TaxID=412755 RepID=A0A0F9EGM4_9ZZZZ
MLCLLKYDRIIYYVSCWHMNSFESDAMWNLYCGGKEGLAIETTYNKLKNSLDNDSMQIGLVEYIDFEEGSGSVLMSKRKAFEHENEVRILYGDYERRTELQANREDIYEKLSQELPNGISFEWDIEAVIERIWVHPRATAMYFEVVEDVILKFAPKLVSRLQWSEMKDIPSWLKS